MTYKVVVNGKFPSLNEFINACRTHKMAANNMKHKSQNEIAVYLVEQLQKVRIDKPVFIKYTYYEKNKKRDLDNISSYFHKVFQDSLVNCKIIHNDSWQYIVGFSDDFAVDNKNPRIEVEIIEVGD